MQYFDFKTLQFIGTLAKVRFHHKNRVFSLKNRVFILKVEFLGIYFNFWGKNHYIFQCLLSHQCIDNYCFKQSYCVVILSEATFVSD
jgi:hypothetical protein